MARALTARAIPFAVEAFKHQLDIRVLDRLAARIGQEVLLGYIGHIGAVLVLGEEVVKRLILARPDFRGNGVPPFLGIGEFRVDVEDHAAKRKDAVPDNGADRKFRYAFVHGLSSEGERPMGRGEIGAAHSGCKHSLLRRPQIAVSCLPKERELRVAARFMGAEVGAPPETGRPAPPPVARRERPLYAAIDLGTNNCRLLIAEPAPAGMRVVESFSRIVRLGEGLAATGELSLAAIGRTLDALAVCADKLRRRRPLKTRFIATQACRAARNGLAFLSTVERETGLRFDLITPQEEARLAVMGCASLIARDAAAALIVDIGGGSSELSWVRAQPGGAPHIEAWVSIPIGVVTLAERFPEHAPRAAWFGAMVDHVHDLIDTAVAEAGFRIAPPQGLVHMIGTSGTVTSLAGVHLGLERYQRHRVDGLWMNAGQAHAASRQLQGLSHAERAAHPCIGPDRADLVLSGCAIFEAIAERWPIDRLRVADRGLREGVLLSLMEAKARRGRRGRGRKVAASVAAPA